jgi:hypothetical protein
VLIVVVGEWRLTLCDFLSTTLLDERHHFFERSLLYRLRFVGPVPSVAVAAAHR